MASQQFPSVTLNALGLEIQGLCWMPGLTFGTQVVAIDGLGLQTGGLVWNVQSQWYPPFVPQAVVWTGCSTCTTSCG